VLRQPDNLSLAKYLNRWAWASSTLLQPAVYYLFVKQNWNFIWTVTGSD